MTDSTETLSEDGLRLLALHLQPGGVGPVTLAAMRSEFGSLQAVFTASEQQLLGVKGVGKERAAAVRASADTATAQQELERCQTAGVQILVFGEPEYPPLLSEIYAPPLILYVLGDLNCLQAFCLAIVGSRRCNLYGQQQAQRFGYALGAAGITVVSGMARGVDSKAHNGVLDAKGKTAAVLGCGIDVVYPPENRDLRDAIVAGGGAIVTEFPFGMQPVAGNFPKRNRIISGLSSGTLVVQAHVRSGALLTANWANDQGRDVFVIPDRIDTPYSQGSHQLIQRGATLVTSVEDILSEYGESPAASPNASDATKAPPPGVVLPSDQQTIYDFLSNEELHIDDLVTSSGMDAPQVNAILLRLQMAGLARQLPGMYYQRA